MSTICSHKRKPTLGGLLLGDVPGIRADELSHRSQSWLCVGLWSKRVSALKWLRLWLLSLDRVSSKFRHHLSCMFEQLGCFSSFAVQWPRDQHLSHAFSPPAQQQSLIEKLGLKLFRSSHWQCQWQRGWYFLVLTYFGISCLSENKQCGSDRGALHSYGAGVENFKCGVERSNCGTPRIVPNGKKAKSKGHTTPAFSPTGQQQIDHSSLCAGRLPFLV